jgi:hypothetical protein
MAGSQRKKTPPAIRFCSEPELEKLLASVSSIGTSVQHVERVIEKLSPLSR